MRKLTSILTLMILLVFTSCLEELGDIAEGRVSTNDLNIKPALAIPLIDTRIMIEDLAPGVDSLGLKMSEGDFGTVVLSYEDVIYSESAEGYYNIPDQSGPPISFSGVDSEGLVINSSVDFSTEGSIDLGTTGVNKIDSILLKGGTLAISVNNTFLADVEATFSIPVLTIEGQDFSPDYNITTGTYSYEYLLNDAKFDFSEALSDNELIYRIEGTINFNNSVVTPDQSIEVSFDVLSPEFSGLFATASGTEILAQQGTQEVNFLQNTTLDGFSIDDPSIALSFKNSFGATVSASVNEVSIVDKDNNNFMLSGTFLTDENPITIQGPTMDQIGESLTTTIGLNTDNSNINELVSQIPSEITYSASGNIIDGQKAYILDTSKVEVSAEVTLPLYGSVNNLNYSEEFEFDSEIFSNLEDAKFTFTLDNSFPASIGAELFFLDENDVILDAFFNDQTELFGAPAIDVNGVSTNVANRVITLDLTRSRLQNLESAVKARLVLIISTSDGGTVPVRFTWSDFINIQAGFEGRASL